MATHRFPLQRLPYDLRSEVLNTMDYHEIFALSFASKKTLSMVRDLRVKPKWARVNLTSSNQLAVFFDCCFYFFELERPGSKDQILTLNDHPASVEIMGRGYRFGRDTLRLTWSNQGRTIGEWIQQFFSIHQRDTRYGVSFESQKMKFDVQSLRNTFPKLKQISIHCSQEEPNENGISSSENVLRAFMPDIVELLLYRLPRNLSIGSIGMANLNFLELYLNSSLFDLKLEDLLSLNVRHCIININEFSLREINRFFKLWIRGFNSRLGDLHIYGYSKAIPDWNLLLKGLKAVEKEEKEEIVEDEDEEESEDEDEAGEAGAQEVRVEAADAERNPEDEPQEEVLDEAEAVAEEEPDEVAEDSEEDEDDEEYEEEEEDEEGIEDEESELEEYEDEEEPKEAQIAPVAAVPRVVPVPRIAPVVPVAPVAQEEEVPLGKRAGAENADVVKKYIIRNCLGVCAEIETEFNITYYVTVSVKLTVKK
ncbi:Protein CBG03584 [Caenorhabditis briggsae]|uniref:Protein CBG03584 n=1 Tax=Caenorhabditis briggsae TaxID=6238 RepID=A8WVE1_CAEBR|nr:Protein CBG03584 [Caenorhabditis briggsae]CAP24452.1 Protein CBG03584 [Caenorhabditis briggsae]